MESSNCPSTIENTSATLQKAVPESKLLNIYRNSLRCFIEGEKETDLWEKAWINYTFDAGLVWRVHIFPAM